MRHPAPSRSRAIATTLAGALLILVPRPGAPAAAPAGRRTLLWPLEVPGILLSSFGEYRYDHLHAGIDISTSGTTGYKVLAADAGEIYRLKVEWRGYGRALYLRHPGGRTTVYGHLERYEDAALGLERLVARRQAEAGTRYPGDIYLDPPLRVRRGQVIAYSGESGVGLPHLHFEVREGDDQPLDPFAASLHPPPDSHPPVLESVTITAASTRTFIDGSLRERVYPMSRRGASYQSEEPIRINGPFLVSASAYDPAGPEGRSGIHSIETRIDGRPAYRLAWRAFRFDQYPQSGLVFDHRASHLAPATFTYRLYRLPGNDLAAANLSTVPASSADVVPWAFDPLPGAHTLEIIAGDEAGNISRASLCLLAGRPGLPEIATPDPSAPAAVVRFSLEESGSGTAAPSPSRSARQAARRGQQCAPAPRAVEGETWDGHRFVPLLCRIDQGACFATHGSTSAGGFGFRIREVRDGVPGPWRLVPADRETGALREQVNPVLEAWPGFVEIALQLLRPDDPRLLLVAAPGGAAIGRFDYRDGLTCAAALDDRLAARAGRLEVATEADPGRIVASLDLESRIADPGETLVARDADLTVEIPPGGRFYPGPLLLRRANVAPVPGLPAVTQAVDLLPDGEPLNVPATLSFLVGTEQAAPLGSLGVYRWDGVTSRWNYEGGEPDPARRTVSLRFRRYGRLALLSDQSPPEIIEVRPADGAREVERRPRIIARVEEAGMGLNYDGVAFVLDGVRLESEFDPDRGQSSVPDPPHLAPGRHTLTVTATDRADNASRPATVAFEVR